MKFLSMAAGMAVALAACAPGGSGAGAGGSEEALANKIVDIGGVLNLDDKTIKDVVDGNTQMVAAQQGNLSSQQAEQLAAAIKANIEASLPDLKKVMAGHLVEAFEPKELEVYLAFVSAESHEAVQQKINMVTQQSLAAASEMTDKAVAKAVADAKLPPPVDPSLPAVPGVVKPPQQ